MDDVPRPDTVNVVPDGTSSICADEGRDKTGQYSGIDRGSMFFLDIPIIAEDVEDKKAGAVGASCVGCVGVLEYFADSK